MESRENEGTERDFTGIGRDMSIPLKVIFRDADVHRNVFPALEKSLDRASVTFVLSAVGPVE